ncbi:DUF4393 domain-containing protein [Castellaniella ginsengisoli]|uniref:DUF4393 domain-containing protein n=1 Tax=Castellaniella ginsengisoli TaxID=546114 RepID=A0AB39GUX3_9BURK
MGWLEDAAKALPVAKAYDDLASPALQEIGQAARSTVKAARFLLAPIDYLAARHDRWINYLKRVNDKVLEENMIPAHPQLSGKVIDGLKYLDEGELLAELFVNLLARAIDKDRVSEAHPAFASIISQLSPDEAVVIFYLNQKERLYLQYAPYNAAKNTFGAGVLRKNEFPTDKLIFPQNFEMYCEHLNSLNLAGIWQHGNQEIVRQGGQQVGVNITSYTKLTSFGKLFAKACLPDDISSFEAS